MQEHSIREAADQAGATARNDRYDFFAGFRTDVPLEIRESIPKKTDNEEITESATATYWG